MYEKHISDKNMEMLWFSKRPNVFNDSISGKELNFFTCSALKPYRFSEQNAAIYIQPLQKIPTTLSGFRYVNVTKTNT